MRKSSASIHRHTWPEEKDEQPQHTEKRNQSLKEIPEVEFRWIAHALNVGMPRLHTWPNVGVGCRAIDTIKYKR